MKRLRYLRILLLILFYSLFLGCTNRAAFPKTPNIGVPENEMNKRVHITAPEGWNTFKIGDAVVLDIEVISNDQIMFNSDFGARIFALEDDQWVEIPNTMKYPAGSILLSPAQGDPFKGGGTSLFPKISDNGKEIVIRIVLIGSIYSDGKTTDKQTAGYVDLTLKP